MLKSAEVSEVKVLVQLIKYWFLTKSSDTGRYYVSLFVVHASIIWFIPGS